MSNIKRQISASMKEKVIFAQSFGFYSWTITVIPSDTLDLVNSHANSSLEEVIDETCELMCDCIHCMPHAFVQENCSVKKSK